MEISSQIFNLIATIIMFILGASMGSFVNATAMRTVAEKKWWGGERSACDHCGAALQTRDLIPLVSYIFLRGKCRVCGGRIARRHFVAELASALLTAGLFLRWGLTPALGMSLAILWFSLFNSLTDLDNGYIYDLWAVALGVLGMAIRVTGGLPALIDGAIGGAVGFGVIALIILLSRGGMGWGDAMLMLGIGAAAGWRYCALSLYLGFLCGGVVVVPLLLTKKLKRKDAVPLGPFLAAGSVLTLFIGDALLARLAALTGRLAGWPWSGM